MQNLAYTKQLQSFADQTCLFFLGDNTVNTVYTILPWKPLKVIGIAYLQAWNDFIINGFDFI